MTTEIKITINNKTYAARKTGFLVTVVNPIAMIAIGIFADSAAMQWMGFFIAILTMLAVGSAAVKKDNDLTIAQARKRLDEIEAENGSAS